MEQRKYRVLHIVPNFKPGGAERLVIELMSACDKERFEIAAVSLYPEGGSILEKEINERGIRAYYLNKRLGLDLRMFHQLYHLFRDFRPDVVHTHLSVLRYSLPPSILCRIPMRVHTVHSIAQKEVDLIGKLIHRIAFKFAKVMPVSISQEIAVTIRWVYGQDIHTPVIYNGVPTVRYGSQTTVDTQKGENIVILHVGSFSPAKNHLLLVEAFGLALKEFPELRLWLAGEGPTLERVKNSVIEKGLSDYVSFLGVRDDVPNLLMESDMFILSSDWEGMPLAVMESMAAGRPVVATGVGAIPEIIKDGLTGIIVPPRNKDTLAAAILRLVKDPDLRERMGKAARGQALESFDISRTAREYETLYLNILERENENRSRLR